MMHPHPLTAICPACNATRGAGCKWLPLDAFHDIRVCMAVEQVRPAPVRRVTRRPDAQGELLGPARAA